MTPRDDTPWLHLRCQFTYHATAEIVGTKAGLLVLRAAVDDALTHGEGEEEAVASDGEGYELRVRRSATVSGLGKPTYLDEEARHLSYMERDYLVRESKSRRAVEKEAFDALRWCHQNGDPHKAASVDTHPQGGDAQQAPSPMGSAVPPQAGDAQPSQDSQP